MIAFGAFLFFFKSVDDVGSDRTPYAIRKDAVSSLKNRCRKDRASDRKLSLFQDRLLSGKLLALLVQRTSPLAFPSTMQRALIIFIAYFPQ